MNPTPAAEADAEDLDVDPPLAHDASGNRLPLPDGTAAWRICRHTAGRPAALPDPEGRPDRRFPLATTAADLLREYGPGAYHIYALDDVGQQLDHVTKLDLSSGLRNARNANEPSTALATMPRAMVVAPVAPAAPEPTTDLRFTLHALTEIARINGEAMRSIANAQADWIKTLAINRGLPRNVAFPEPPPPSSARAEDDEDDGENEDDDADDYEDDAPAVAAPTTWADFANNALKAVEPLAVPLMATYGLKVPPKLPPASTPSPVTDASARAKAPASESAKPPPTDTPTLSAAQVARIHRMLQPSEATFFVEALAHEEAGAVLSAQLAELTIEDAAARVRRFHADTQRAQAERRAQAAQSANMDPVDLLRRIKARAPALLAHLSGPTRARLLALAPQLDPAMTIGKPAVIAQLAQLDALTTDEAAAAWIESNLDEIVQALAS